MKALFALFRTWFFAPGDPRTAAALRIAFCGIYLFIVWDFHPVLHLLFGADGLYAPSPLSAPNELSPLGLLHRFPQEGALELWYWSSIAVTGLALIGFRTRLTLTLAYVSLLLFQARGSFVIFGADLVLRMCGVWLLFLPAGRVWSVDAWLARVRARTAAVGSSGGVSSWPIKAIQIQCALIYLISFLCKIQTPPWQDGSAVYYALQVGDLKFGQAFALLKDVPAVFPLITYATLVFEALFIVLVFYRPTRNLALVGGLLFHAGVDVMMSIRFFSLTMFLGYLAYLDRADWEALRGWVPKRAVGWGGRAGRLEVQDLNGPRSQATG